MNILLVPTDFSPAAENATAYAVQLAQKIDASILLLHVYQVPVPMADYPVLIMTTDELRRVADEGLQKAREKAAKKFAGVAFEAESRLGDIVEEINDLAKEKNPFAVVIGTKGLTGFDRFLFGDTTVSLAKNCPYPVIAVPEESNAGLPANIVLATDLLNAADIPAANIRAIANVLGAKLHIIHVESTESTTSGDELLSAFPGVNASYHAIREDDVTEGIRHYVTQNNIDLVLVLPHKHTLYERLFFKGHTQSILHGLPVPVMSLRND